MSVEAKSDRQKKSYGRNTITPVVTTC